MKNNLKHWLVLMFVALGVAVCSVAVLREVTASAEKLNHHPLVQMSPAGARHPLKLTPEETLRTILMAYVARDIETVLAYLPPVARANPERMTRLREQWGYYMTDQAHVKRVVEIRLDKVTSSGKDRVAVLWTKIETTPRFSGVPDLGGNIREYRWVLRQAEGKGPWFHDGGGF
jgi:hypothetical protein